MNTDPQPSPATSDAPQRRGLLGTIVMLIGSGCLLIALVSVFNTAFDLNLALGVSGTSTPLPDSWESTAGLAAAGALLVGLSLFGSTVVRLFRAAKDRPRRRVAIVLGALALLIIAGRGIQLLVLNSTYGSMLAYYATGSNLDRLRRELAKDPTTEQLDAAVSRAAQHDNVPALELLLEAGADFRQTSYVDESKRSCLIAGSGAEFLALALDHDVGPDSCPNSSALIWTVVNHQPSERGDSEVAEMVTMLVAAGWSPTATPEFSDESPRAIAERGGLSETVAALDAASGG